MRARGFSLLEVMVAIAILGLTLTVILSAQGGLAASNRSAANMGQAVAIGRCRMTEIEENLLKLGFQEIDQIETGVKVCCDDKEVEGYTCDWRVEKVELPNLNAGNALGDGGLLTSNTANLPGMANPAGGAGLDLADGGLQALGSQVAGQFGMGVPGMPGTTSGVGGAGAEGMLGMVMGMVYPAIKPMYEQSIRRVTVTVRWKEGPNARELPITQFVTNPQRGGFAGSALLPDGGTMDFAPPDGTGTGTTGTGTGTTGGPGRGAGAGTGTTPRGGGF